MKINFYAALREFVGGKTIDLPNKAGKTVQEMLDELLVLYPGLGTERLTHGSDHHTYSVILINRQDVRSIEKTFKTVVSPGDVIDIFPPTVSPAPHTITQEMRSMPLWLLREYLVDLGGIAVSDALILGDGWRVSLEKMPPFRLGSLEVGQVRVEFVVDESIEKEFLDLFALKTLRAGA